MGNGEDDPKFGGWYCKRMHFECFNTWGATGVPGPTGATGATGATGPTGRGTNDVDPDNDCEGPVGEYKKLLNRYSD